MNPEPHDLLAIALLIAGVAGGALYATILLGQGAGRRNGRVEILMSAGGLIILAMLARSLRTPDQLLYAATVGVLLALLIANQWRWHRRTRLGR